MQHRGDVVTTHFGDNIGGDKVGGSKYSYSGPVFHGDVQDAQFAWQNRDASQSAGRSVAPGYEPLAEVLGQVLAHLDRLGLSRDQVADAEAAATDALDEATGPTPDPGVIRRALAIVKGVLAPVAMGMAAGSTEGAQEWTRTAIEQIGTAFS